MVYKLNLFLNITEFPLHKFQIKIITILQDFSRIHKNQNWSNFLILWSNWEILLAVILCCWILHLFVQGSHKNRAICYCPRELTQWWLMNSRTRSTVERNWASHHRSCSWYRCCFTKTRANSTDSTTAIAGFSQNSISTFQWIIVCVRKSMSRRLSGWFQNCKWLSVGVEILTRSFDVKP